MLGTIFFEQLDDALEKLTTLSAAQQTPLEFAKKHPSIPSDIRILALEAFEGRKKISEYFPSLLRGYFTKQGLEQRTHPAISRYHASMFPKGASVLEIGCGLGFDTVTLASRFDRVTTLEIDPIHAAFARKNFELLDITNIDVVEMSFETYRSTYSIDVFDSVFADPARRGKGMGRTKDVEQFSPPLSSLLSLNNPKVIIKINPTNTEAYPGWSNQWIGFDGECKEKLLLKGIGNDKPVALIGMHGSVETVSVHQESHPKNIDHIPTAPCILAEPHPAIRAAGISRQILPRGVFSHLPPPSNLSIGNGEGLSLGEDFPKEAFRFFSIFRIESFRMSKLKDIIAELSWDQRTELKKSNFPEEPESFRSQLPLRSVESSKDDSFGVIFFTRFKEKKIMCFGHRLSL